MKCLGFVIRTCGLFLIASVAATASTQPYAVLDAANIVVAIVQWDGVTSYSPCSPCTLVATNGNSAAQVGGTYSAGVFAAPAPGMVLLLTPITGQTITLPNAPQPQAKLYLILEPAAALSTLTVQLPPSPQDGDDLYILSTKGVTTLTVSAPNGQSVLNMPTSLTAGNGVHVVYSVQYNTFACVPSS